MFAAPALLAWAAMWRRPGFALSLAALAGLAGCALSQPTPVARVRTGPAFGAAPRTILALPAECRPEVSVCKPGHELAVSVATRMSLEFAGYRIFDSERLNVRAGERTERFFGDTAREDRAVELTAAAWDQASPAQRAALLADLGIDGLLVSSISIGPRKNSEGQRTIAVTVTLRQASDGSLVWRTRCGVESGRFNDTDQAIETATRCALEGAAVAGAT